MLTTLDISIQTRIAGIPCIAQVTHYMAGDPGRVSGPPEHCYPPDPGELDWIILDRRGRPAPWLERKMTDQDIDRIGSKLLDVIERTDWDAWA